MVYGIPASLAGGRVPIECARRFEVGFHGYTLGEETGNNRLVGVVNEQGLNSMTYRGEGL